MDDEIKINIHNGKILSQEKNNKMKLTGKWIDLEKNTQIGISNMLCTRLYVDAYC